MARASKAKSTRQTTNSVKDAAANASVDALRMAGDAARGPARTAKAETIAKLAAMCQEAAGHMADAQSVLFDGRDGGEAAIDHLDAALQCLNRLADEGERFTAGEGRKAHSA